MFLFRIATLLSIAFAPLAVSAQSETVRLVSRESGLVLTGQIVLFDGVNYRFLATIGEVLIAANQVDCIGGDCPAEPSASGAEFGVYGSNTIGAALMPGLVEAYADQNGGFVERELTDNPVQSTLIVLDDQDREMAMIDLRAEGSSTSFPALLGGEAQIGMSSRKVRDSEIASFAEAGIPGLDQAGREHVVALDGLIVIVSRENPLTSISLGDVARIFAGEISNWSQIGGPDAAINIYARDNESGTWDTFKSLVLRPAKLDLAERAQRFQSNARLSDSVAADPFGIGFTGFAYERNAKALALRTSCGLEIPPTTFGVKTEEYPLARRLYLYTTGAQLAPVASELLGYALSDEAQPVVSQIGFVDQAVDVGAGDGEAARLNAAAGGAKTAVEAMMARAIAAELQGAIRLSPTLRFSADGRRLDVKSRGDVARLARFISDALTPNQEVLLVGYTDDQPGLEASFDEGLSRAQRIKESLQADIALIGGRRDARITPLSYGGLAPVACNDGDKGRSTNRRVEVWLRETR